MPYIQENELLGYKFTACHSCLTLSTINENRITNLEVEHACDRGTTLWSSGNEGREKRMTEHH
jgi:hypothetical protein